MDRLGEALGGLVIFSCLVIIVFIIAKYTYMIKKAMIEKGLVNKQTLKKNSYIDIGCIVIGLGIGVLLSSIYTEMDLSEDTMDLLIWGTILIFGGISLLVAHFIRKKLEK